MPTDFGAHVGRKGGTETVANVLLAFLESRTWRQAELAKRAGVERKQIVREAGQLQILPSALLHGTRRAAKFIIHSTTRRSSTMGFSDLAQ